MTIAGRAKRKAAAAFRWHAWLQGKTVLITGATSGLGAAAAIELHRLGARLALLDRDADGVRRGNKTWPAAGWRRRRADVLQQVERVFHVDAWESTRSDSARLRAAADAVDTYGESAAKKRQSRCAHSPD